MAYKRTNKLFQWQGSESRLYRGEPLIRFIIPKRGNHNHNSTAFWNYQDRVLTVNLWLELPYAADKRSAYRMKHALREICHPENDMIIVENSTVKGDNSMVLNIQYFARLSTQPTAEDMIAILKALEENICPMSLYEYRLLKAAEEARKQDARNRSLSRMNDDYST